MAATAGYPVKQIQSCSQFKRVHNFILEVWEALYRCMLCRFLDKHNCKILSTQTPEELKQYDETCGSQEKNSSVEFYEKIVILLENISSQPMNTFKHSFNCCISEINNLMARMNFQEFHKLYLSRMIHGGFGHSLSFRMHWHTLACS